MLTIRRNGREVRAMILSGGAVDKCIGVVQCAVTGCEAHAAIVADSVDGTAAEQIEWFMKNHDCDARRFPKSKHRSGTREVGR